MAKLISIQEFKNVKTEKIEFLKSDSKNKKSFKKNRWDPEKNRTQDMIYMKLI